MCCVHIFLAHSVFPKKVKRQLQFFTCRFHRAIAFDPAFQFLDLAHLHFCGFGVIPKSGGLRLFFFFFYADFFAFNVKDTSSAHPRAPADLSVAQQ
jgi:hypothetical protein